MKNNNKRNKMNNFKKIGLSALAGSLAMVSAHAVEYTMTGGLMTTFTSEQGEGAAPSGGKGFGSATDLGFNASGELDNGYTVSYFMSVDTDAALANTSSQMKLGMGSLGSLHLNNKAGSKANAIDDVMPAAYQETWDGLTAASSNGSFFGNRVNAGSIDYRIPAQSLMGTTINASVTYDPGQGAGGVDAKGVGTTGNSGVAYTLQFAHESGVEIGGGHEALNDGDIKGGNPTSGETENNTAYIKYATGPFSMGYQAAIKNAAHGITAKGRDQEANMMAVAYTSGNTTVSYAESELINLKHGATAEVSTELESVQIAHVMGAMTLSAAVSETKNANATLGQKYEENTLAVSFAF